MRSLIKDWRIRTERKTTEDEFNVIVTSLFAIGGIDAGAINVKPSFPASCHPWSPSWTHFARKYLGHAPQWVDARSYTRMPILINNPSELGADRIVNSVAAYQKYGEKPHHHRFRYGHHLRCGFRKGEYLGGAISPGIMIASEALFREASKLPRVEIFEQPDNVVGKDTAGSIKSGIIFGYAGLVDGIVGRMKEQMDHRAHGAGHGRAGAPDGQCGPKHRKGRRSSLTLEGLRIISDSLKGQS
jgi:type III pantothenate kinase